MTEDELYSQVNTNKSEWLRGPGGLNKTAFRTAMIGKKTWVPVSCSRSFVHISHLSALELWDEVQGYLDINVYHGTKHLVVEPYFLPR